ncbi:MAG: hypothetical protein U0359_16530 [Byssovorax sp.]
MVARMKGLERNAVCAAMIAVFALIAPGCKLPEQKKPPPGPVEWVADRLPVSAPDTRIEAIGGTGPNDVWAVGWGFYHYDGKTWSDRTPRELSGYGTAMTALSAVAPDDVWAVGVNGRVAHFDGKSWSGEQIAVARVSPLPDVKGYFNLIDVLAFPGEVWVTASARAYYRYDRRGAKGWTVVPVPEVNPGTFQQIWGSSPTDVWRVSGRMDHFDGTRWDTSMSLPVGLRKAHGSGPDDVWAAGWKGHFKKDDGALMHFDGKRWIDIALPPGTPLLWSVSSRGPGRAYAVGDHGWALAFDGTTWRTSNTGVKETLRDVFVTDGAAFAIGDIGPVVLRTSPAR